MADTLNGFTVPVPPVPPNLHVCRESRYEAMRHYHKLYSFGDEVRYAYVNASRDALTVLDDPVCGASTSLASSPPVHVRPSPVTLSFASTIQTIIVPQDILVDLQPHLSHGTRTATTGLLTNSRLITQNVIRNILAIIPALQHITVMVLPSEKGDTNTSDLCPSHSSMSPLAVRSKRTICCLSEPRVRNRFAERRLRNAMNVISDELGQLRGTRPPPTWSIKAASSCSSGCLNMAPRPLQPEYSVLARQLLHDRTDDEVEHDRSSDTGTRPRKGAAFCGREADDRNGDNDEERIQRLPPSWQSCRSGTPHRLASIESVGAGSLALPEATTMDRAGTQASPQIQRRCGWPLTDVPGTSGILDFAASRLAFHQRFYYWS